MDGADRILSREVCRTFKSLRCTQDCVEHEVQKLAGLVGKFENSLSRAKNFFPIRIHASPKPDSPLKRAAVDAFCVNVNNLHEGVSLDCKQYQDG